MKWLQFEIPGEPVAKGRARSFVRNGKIAHHTPDKTARYESRVALLAKVQMKGRPPMEGPLKLTVSAYLGIGSSWSKKRQLAAIEGQERPTKRPDIDNVVKAIKDGLNGIAWIDDSQVVDLVAGKQWSDVPRVFVSVRKVTA